MLLLNKGMMQFIKHPLHRNDYGIAVNVFIHLLSGPELSEIEKQNAINLGSSADYFNKDTFVSILRGSRTTLSSIGVAAASINLKRSHSSDASGSVYRFSEASTTFVVTNAETLSNLIIVFTIPNSVGARLGFHFSIGLPGSGADIEMEKVDYVAGERIKLNDIVISIENLLGET